MEYFQHGNVKNKVTGKLNARWGYEDYSTPRLPTIDALVYCIISKFMGLEFKVI